MTDTDASNKVVVVGAVNIDLSGIPMFPLILNDSNPGTVRKCYGGVGRNVAENMARLGVDVALVTALGDDADAENIIRSCEALNIDISHSLRVKNMNTSTYLCINDNKGDMNVAISDMAIYRQMGALFLQKHIDFINKSRYVVVDANMSEEAINFIADYCTVPIIAETVSTKKAVRFLSAIRSIYLLRTNRLELEALTGQPTRDNNEIEHAAQVLINQGVKHIVVSAGSAGAYYFNGEDFSHYDSITSRVVNTTGCGDAFLGGMVYAMINGVSVKEAVHSGLAAASICIESSSTISEKMTAETLKSRL